LRGLREFPDTGQFARQLAAFRTRPESLEGRHGFRRPISAFDGRCALYYIPFAIADCRFLRTVSGEPMSISQKKYFLTQRQRGSTLLARSSPQSAAQHMLLDLGV